MARAALKTPDRVETLLLELVAEVRGLRADLAGKKARPKPDQVSDAEFMAAIGASNPNGACFSAVELLAHAAVDAGLRRALCGFTNPRQLGNKLRALAGLDINGCALKRIGRDETGCIWQLHTEAGFGDGGRV